MQHVLMIHCTVCFIFWKWPIHKKYQMFLCFMEFLKMCKVFKVSFYTASKTVDIPSKSTNMNHAYFCITNCLGCLKNEKNMEIILKTNIKWEILLIIYDTPHQPYNLFTAAGVAGHWEVCPPLVIIKTIKDYENGHNPCLAPEMRISSMSL